MIQLNDALEKLRQAVAAYCIQLRKGEELANAAHKLRIVFKKVLPDLAQTFNDNDPDIIYAERIVQSAVDQLDRPDNRHPAKLWSLYFVQNSTAKDVAVQTDFSEESIKRHVEALPRMVTVELFKLNKDIIALGTPEDRQNKILQDAFQLTPRQAEVLLVYTYTLYKDPDITRKEIAARLFITENTLKRHISKIIKAVGANKMGGAARMAVEVLRETPDSGWKL